MRTLAQYGVACLRAGCQSEPMQPTSRRGANLTNAFADFDNDGDLDLFVGFDGKPNRLYRNDKGVFTDVAAAAGVADARPTRAVAWGDFDARRRSRSCWSASRPVPAHRC